MSITSSWLGDNIREETSLLVGQPSTILFFLWIYFDRLYCVSKTSLIYMYMAIYFVYLSLCSIYIQYYILSYVFVILRDKKDGEIMVSTRYLVRYPYLFYMHDSHHIPLVLPWFNSCLLLYFYSNILLYLGILLVSVYMSLIYDLFAHFWMQFGLSCAC